MSQDALNQRSGRGDRANAGDLVRFLTGEIDVAVQLLHRALDCHTESIRDLEALAVRLLEVPWSDLNEQPATGTVGRSELLTAQQARVLEQICLGRTNRQVAKILGITEKTAKNYTQAVFRKLGVHSRTEAALVAVRHRWFETGTTHAEPRIPRQRDGTSSPGPARENRRSTR